MMNIYDNTTVSVIFRTTGEKLDDVEKSIFSIYCNTYPSIEIIIVYQGSNELILDALNCIMKKYRGLQSNIIQYDVKTTHTSGQAMNAGIESAAGRYISFFHDGAIMFPNHLQSLVKTMNNSGSVWSITQFITAFKHHGYTLAHKMYHQFAKFDYRRLLFEDYLPLCSYMIDRKKCHSDDIAFPCLMPGNDNYAFLLQFAHQYPRPGLYTTPTVVISCENYPHTSFNYSFPADNGYGITNHASRLRNEREQINELKKEIMKKNIQLQLKKSFLVTMQIKRYLTRIKRSIERFLMRWPFLYTLIQTYYRKVYHHLEKLM